MKRVLTALVLIPLVLLAVFRAPDWLFTLLVGVVAVLATIEYLQIAAKYGYKVFPVLSCACVAVLFGGGMLSGPNSWVGSRHGALLTGLAVAVAFPFLFAPSLFLAAGMR